MPQGSKASYSPKQKAQAAHIEASYEQKGISHDKAEAIAWATVNKQTGGGEISGSGKYTSEAEKAQARSDSAQNAAHTRHEKEKPDSLESHSKTELLAKARKKRISGRSTMNKQELILALRKP
jgi:hypothetical protein